MPSPFSLDRYLGTSAEGHAMKQRLREVDYVILDSIEPDATEQKVHTLLLQAIQDAQLLDISPFPP